LAFADDNLLICDSPSQLELAIELVKVCEDSNIRLNPQKSGIMEMISSKRRKVNLQIGSCCNGIPAIESYRYLGLVLDNKLKGDSHVKKTKAKLSFLASRLAPILGKVSIDYRINLWKVLVKSLFKRGLGVMYDNTKLRIKSLERVLKKFFKMFTGLSPRTPDCILSELIS